MTYTHCFISMSGLCEVKLKDERVVGLLKVSARISSDFKGASLRLCYLTCTIWSDKPFLVCIFHCGPIADIV